MLCRNPYQRPFGVRAIYPCGQCNPCRFNRARLWTSRLILESFGHESSCFVTLTYSPENLPPRNSLVPEHGTKFIKRLRHHLGKTKIRYFLVGEYGDQTQRPHYHLALFGIGQEFENLVRETWGLGHVDVGDLSPHSARYITGYVVKKLTDKRDVRLNGRHPEFARMSKGIGKNAIPAIAASLSSDVGRAALDNTIDVPTFLRAGSKTLPLGRYLRTQLRRALDVYRVDAYTGEVKYGASEESLLQSTQELQDLWQAWADIKGDKKESFQKFLVSLDDGKVALMESRLETQNLRRKL